jgi:hypothetical protein
MRFYWLRKWCGGLCAGALAASLLGGCVEGAEAARDRASQEYGCPPERLHVKDIGPSQIGEVYRVAGCDIVSTYACNDSGDCIKESDSRRAIDAIK